VSRLLEARVVPRCVELLDGPTLAAVRARGVAIDAAAGAMLLLEVDGADVAVEREVRLSAMANSFQLKTKLRTPAAMRPGSSLDSSPFIGHAAQERRSPCPIEA
jgi:hypothetical protein